MARPTDRTRGTGPEKQTTAESPSLESGPEAMDNGTAAGEPDPARGGCMRFGWGCLPVVAGLVIAVPSGLLY